MNNSMVLEHKSDIFDNGDSYVGKHINGLRNGFGHYTWGNGNYFIGEFKDGLKHGYGFWSKSKDPNSNQYRGEFLNDKKCGYGVFKWSSGNYYKGNYKNDEREGYGEMHWIDGSVYRGNWHNGIQHGHGTMIFPDGTFIKGNFKNNVFLGNNKLPDRIMTSSRETEIEAHIYNLPSLANEGYKSVIGRKGQPIFIDSNKYCLSPKVITRRIIETRKSIELNSMADKTFYPSQYTSMLNSSLGHDRNTYQGFMIEDNRKKRKKFMKNTSLGRSKTKMQVSKIITPLIF
jgi:hypothetical protein